jgi:hypothetical protein
MMNIAPSYSFIILCHQDDLKELETRCEALKEQNKALFEAACAALASWRDAIDENSILLQRLRDAGDDHHD